MVLLLMATLILGHLYGYTKNIIRCSPIDVDFWYDKEFKCVDYKCCKNTTDFNYDIYRSIDYRFDEKGIKYDGFWVWKFVEDNSYDIIIDCTGSINWDKQKNQYKYNDELLKTIIRVLRTNGIYTKTNNGILLFEPKKRNGYQYID